MSTKPAAPPAPLAPPDEEFWDKYSPHHEFPLSTIGSVAMHIGVFAALAGLLWLAFKSTISDKTPVPMRSMIVHGDNSGPSGSGMGGGTEKGEENIPQNQVIPKPVVPDAVMEQVSPEVKRFLPNVPSNTAGLRPEDLKNIPKYAGLDPELQRKLMEGASGNKGTGKGEGAGGAGAEGKGAGTAGDPSSSASRGIRWDLNFKTSSGQDYLEQLRAMKATLVIPQPSDWRTYKSYRLTEANPAGEEFDLSRLPGLHFIDDQAAAVSGLARAMGLAFSPPRMLAFFPKDIEEELARLEREFRGRKESEIFSTSFRVVVRNGKPHIQVIEQEAVRK